jgi:hypothetical protein
MREQERLRSRARNLALGGERNPSAACLLMTVKGDKLTLGGEGLWMMKTSSSRTDSWIRTPISWSANLVHWDEVRGMPSLTKMMGKLTLLLDSIRFDRLEQEEEDRCLPVSYGLGELGMRRPYERKGARIQPEHVRARPWVFTDLQDSDRQHSYLPVRSLIALPLCIATRCRRRG